MQHRLTPDLLRRSWRAWASSDLQPPGPAWLQWVWSGVFAIACALLFTLAGMAFSDGATGLAGPSVWAQAFAMNLWVASWIAFGIHAAFWLLIPRLGQARIAAWSDARRGIFYTAVPMLLVLLLWPLSVWLLGVMMGGWRGLGVVPRADMGFVVFALMFSLINFLYFRGKARLEQAERRAAEAQLRLLQGQIEPHFLFNTLANVVGLIEVEPQRARRMLEHFIDYLRGSLGGLRNESHTLGQELALLQAYLGVVALRMDDRLRVRLEVPEALHATPLPPLLLQPLVENAIHHGLEPKVEGGTIELRAAVLDGRLHLDVLDDGLGLQAAGNTTRRGSGTALRNIRERLQAAYGGAASLQVEPRPQGGVRASLQLPWPTHPAV